MPTALDEYERQAIELGWVRACGTTTNSDPGRNARCITTGMGYPDQIRSDRYIPLPAFAIMLALALSAVLPILLMLQNR